MFKFTFFILLTSIAITSPAKSKKAELLVQSKEDVEFVAATKSPFLDFAKSKDFVGYFNRPNEASKDLSRVDVYIPPAKSEITMNKEICEEILTGIFGPLKKGTLKYKGATLFIGHTGKTCEAQFDDPDKEALYPERHAIVGFIRMKPVALVFRLSKKSADSDRRNMKTFWNTLR